MHHVQVRPSCPICIRIRSELNLPSRAWLPCSMMSCNHVQQLESKCAELDIDRDWVFRYKTRKHQALVDPELLTKKPKIEKDFDYSKSYVARSWASDPEFDKLRSQNRIKGLLPKCSFCRTNTSADLPPGTNPATRDPQQLLSRAKLAIDTLGDAATDYERAMYAEALRWLEGMPDAQPQRPPQPPDDATCRAWLEEACFNGGECRHCIDEVDGARVCPTCTAAIPDPLLSLDKDTTPVRGMLFSSAR